MNLEKLQRDIAMCKSPNVTSWCVPIADLESMFSTMRRQESELAKSHDENETLKAEREAMTLQLATRQPLADSFVAPLVTVDTPEYFYAGDLPPDQTVVNLHAAIAHTARAVAAATKNMVPLSVDGNSVWIDGRGAVDLVQSVAGELPPPDWWVKEMQTIWCATLGAPITLDMKRAANIAIKVASGMRYDEAGEWVAAQPVQQPAAVGNQHYESGRKQGRAEALTILMQIEPECGIDEYIGWRNSGAPEDEGSAYWNELKLRELFAVDGMLADMMDKAEGEYWRYLGMKDEAEHAKNFAANMHNSGKVREVLSKAGEFDLMGQLCGTAAVPAAGVQGDVQIVADANKYQFLKAHSFNATRRGFDGPYVSWTLEIPAANEQIDSLDAAIAYEMNFVKWKAPYATVQLDSGRDAALVPDLHDQIMRLPSRHESADLRGKSDTELRAYQIGHRDARHAAAEIAAAFQANAAHPAPSSDSVRYDFEDAKGRRWRFGLRSEDAKCDLNPYGRNIVAEAMIDKGDSVSIDTATRLRYFKSATDIRLRPIFAAHPANGTQAGG